MINNDYVRGYFDAHGAPVKISGCRVTQRYGVVIDDSNAEQVSRVREFLLKEGFHPRHYKRKDRRRISNMPMNVLALYRQAEVKRFAKEIGTERPEWQERFNKLST